MKANTMSVKYKGNPKMNTENIMQTVKTVVGCTVVLAATAITVRGGTGPRFDIETNDFPQPAMSASSDGTNFLVGLLGNSAAQSARVVVQRISSTGSRLGASIDLGEDASGAPTVVFGGTNYLVLWSDTDTMAAVGQRISCGGELMGASFPIGSTDVRQGVYGAYDGVEFLVIWEDNNHQVYGRIVSSTGGVGSAQILISVGGNGRDPSIACDGTNYLVTFTSDRRTANGWFDDVYGQFVSRSGTLVGANFVIDANDSPSDNGTATAFDGQKYAVLFHDQVPDVGGQWHVFARHVTLAGTVEADRIHIAPCTNRNVQFPSIVYDGSNYLIAVNEGGLESDATVRACYYDGDLNRVTPWFSLAEPSSTYETFVAAGLASGGGKSLAGLPSMGPNGFTNAYGVMIDANSPAFSHIGISSNSVTMSLTNLFFGSSNIIERAASLTGTNWTAVNSLTARSSSTNWSEAVTNSSGTAFYRLHWK
ncbi:MAG: hypothetical protein PHR35_18560 [Kiritimatiellae bacterium]|nr:hypothetical protein [Kiritimatiellia bacterium]